MIELSRVRPIIFVLIIIVLCLACSPATRSEITIVPTELEATLIASSTPESRVTIASSSRFNEAPMLAERVAKGELPPIEERIPSNPRVVPVVEAIGEYGGTWRRGYTGLADRFGPTKLIEERIIEFYMADADSDITLELNWADQFEANEDSTEFTIHIREGLRWSDGVEVTTEDVRFWYEDILLNEEFFPTIPVDLVVNDEPILINIIDEYTFIIRFAAPYPLFPTIVARSTPAFIGLQGTSYVLPSPYLKDYHPLYRSREELDEIAESYGLDSWMDLWGEGPIQAWWLNPDLPVLSAWKITIPPPADTIVMERNPYYHAVDAEGNQLPYIDFIVHELAQEDEGDIIPLWAIQGLIDLQARHISVANLDLFERNQDEGNYHLVYWRGGSTEALYPNLNTSNAVLATLFDDIRFRQALSVSINRQEILTLQFNDLGEVRQASPVSGSPQFDAEFEVKWTEYDPQTANDLLDEIGLTEYDSEGYRLDAKGETLSITISAQNSEILLGYIQQYWADIGIKVNLDIVPRMEYETRAASGDVEMGYWDFDRNVIIAADPGRYLGTTTDGPWMPLYAEWYSTGGQAGIEPPPDHAVRDVWTAWDNARTAPNIETANMFLDEMVSIHRENVWVIGLVGERPSLYIVSNRMHNFPDNLIQGNSLRDIGLAQPVQFFFED